MDPPPDPDPQHWPLYCISTWNVTQPVCRLEHLAKKFKHKADIHEAWTSGKEEMLSSQVLTFIF
jgi:hypothetical protein